MPEPTARLQCTVWDASALPHQQPARLRLPCGRATSARPAGQRYLTAPLSMIIPTPSTAITPTPSPSLRHYGEAGSPSRKSSAGVILY